MATLYKNSILPGIKASTEHLLPLDQDDPLSNTHIPHSQSNPKISNVESQRIMAVLQDMKRKLKVISYLPLDFSHDPPPSSDDFGFQLVKVSKTRVANQFRN